MALFQNFDASTDLANDMMMAITVVEFVADAPVAEVTALYQTQLLERAQASVNGDQVADLRPDFLVKILHGKGAMFVKETAEQKAARFCHAHTLVLEHGKHRFELGGVSWVRASGHWQNIRPCLPGKQSFLPSGHGDEAALLLLQINCN